MRTHEGQRASIENLPPAVMQALYHSITGRREKLSRNFDGHYIIRQPDIRILVEKIEQTLQQFNYQAASANITVFHFKGEKLVLSSLEKLSQYDSSRGDPVSQLSVEVDFLLAVPQIGSHQGYKIQVDINSYVLGEDDSIASTGISNYDEPSYCLRSTIEYIDYVVARSFHSTVSEWVEGLEQTEILKVWTALPRHRLWAYQGAMALCAGVAISLAAANVVASVFPDTSVPVSISVVASAALIGHGIFNMFAEYIFERIGITWYFPYIILNKGDERNYTKFIQRRQRAARVGWLVLGSGVVWIIASVLSKVILRQLGY